MADSDSESEATAREVTFSLMEDSEETEREFIMPLIGMPVTLDDRDANVVLVFTKSTSAGGTVDVDKTLPNAVALADELFRQSPEEQFTGCSVTGLDGVHDGMTMGEYQEVVRGKIVEFLKGLGFIVSTFQSVDEDEIFVKIGLSEDRKVLHDLAERFHYTMPFKAEAYENTESYGGFAGGEPMRNEWGDVVPAHTRVTPQVTKYIDRFKPIDLARIVATRLNITMNLEAMVEQQVLERWFVGACSEDMKVFNSSWASLRRLFVPPHAFRSKQDDEVRAYFGEQVAFFFVFFSRYIHGLYVAGGLGLIAFFRRYWFADELIMQRYVQMGFAAVMLVWSVCFVKMFQRASARFEQKWGTAEYESNAYLRPERKEFRRELKGTWALTVRNALGQIFTGLFMYSFVAIVLWMTYAKHTGKPFVKGHFAILTSLLIKVYGFGWGMIAPLLASWQNPRTQTEFDENLTWSLAPVKIFLTLFPYAQIAFFNKWTGIHCGDSLLAVADHQYKGDFPSATYPNVTEATLTPHFAWEEEGKWCMYGCFPVECYADGACKTNCTMELESGLLVFFITHVVCTLIFLVIPIFLVRFNVKREVLKVMAAREQAEGESEDESVEKSYSFLQVQSKCDCDAAYEYKSWGGSYVEDFLELAICFALITCFGVALPVMVFLALIAGIIEYRLLAYRMTNVTCRPYPLLTAGIGSWLYIIQAISFVAVICNAAYVSMVMYPLRNYPALTQFELFVALEHAVIFIKIGVYALIPSTPVDVRVIGDFNAHFLRTATKYGAEHVHPEEQNNHLKPTDLSLD